MELIMQINYENDREKSRRFYTKADLERVLASEGKSAVYRAAFFEVLQTKGIVKTRNDQYELLTTT